MANKQLGTESDFWPTAGKKYALSLTAHKDPSPANNHMGLEADSALAEPLPEITDPADTLIAALRVPEAEDPAKPKLLSHGNCEKLSNCEWFKLLSLW